MKTLPNPMGFPAEITLTLPATAICPVTHERDDFLLTVRYQPSTVVLEFESFREWVGRFAGRELYHEEIVAEVRAVLSALLLPWWLEVKDLFSREGLDYTVHALPIGRST